MFFLLAVASIFLVFMLLFCKLDFTLRKEDIDVKILASEKDSSRA